MFQLTKAIVVICFLMARSFAQGKGATDQRALSVCDILADPIKYNGRLVAIRGVSEGTDEGWWIGAGKPCNAPLVTGGYTWPSIIWVGSVGGPQMSRRVEFRTDQRAVDRIDREVRRMRIDPKLDRVWLTFIGLFETREFTARDVGRAGGAWRAFGFGHLNTAPGQLFLKTVRDLYVERGAAHQ
jgi:hypothetical protein